MIRTLSLCPLAKKLSSTTRIGLSNAIAYRYSPYFLQRCPRNPSFSISANLIAYREGVTTGGKSVQLFARRCRGFLPRRSVEWYARVARPCEKRRDSSHAGPQFMWAFRDGDPRCAACVRHADQYRISVRRLQPRRDMRAQLYRAVRRRVYTAT